MDPNTCLATIRSLAARIIESPIDEDAFGIVHDDDHVLAEHIRALDEWLTNSGFLPEAWKR